MDEEHNWPEYQLIKQYAFDALSNELNEQIQLRNLGQNDIFLLGQVFMPGYVYIIVKYQYDSEYSLRALDKQFRDLYDVPIQNRNDLWHARKAFLKKTDELLTML